MLKPRINKKQIALALLLVGLSVWSVFAQYNTDCTTMKRIRYIFTEIWKMPADGYKF